MQTKEELLTEEWLQQRGLAGKRITGCPLKPASLSMIDQEIEQLTKELLANKYNSHTEEEWFMQTKEGELMEDPGYFMTIFSEWHKGQTIDGRNLTKEEVMYLLCLERGKLDQGRYGISMMKEWVTEEDLLGMKDLTEQEIIDLGLLIERNIESEKRKPAWQR